MDDIVAKVRIEADTSGAEEAAAALEALKGVAGDGSIGDALAQQFAAGTKGAEEFADAVGAVEEPVRTGEQAISEMTDTLGEHQQAVENVQQAVENVGASYENLQKPLDRANESFTAFGKSTADVQAAMEEFNRSDPWASFNDQFGQGGSSGFVAETLWHTGEAAKAASVNVSGFATSTEDANKAVQSFLGSDSAQYFSDVSSSTADANKAVSEFLGTTTDANKAIEETGRTAEKTGGIFSGIFGEEGVFGAIGEGVGGVSDFFGGLVMGLNEVAMPLMAVQMLGQMGSSAASWIYNANLAAEGPNASSPYSYTSQAGLLGANVTQGGNQFAVGIGQGLLPAIEGWNAASGGASDPWQSIGDAIGKALGIGGSGLQMMGGGLAWLLGGGGLFGNNALVNAGQNWMTSGYEGDVNTIAQMLGQPAPFTTSSIYSGQNQLAAWQQSHYTGTTGPGDPMNAYEQAVAENAYIVSHGGGTLVNVPAPTADIAANEQYFNSMPFNPISANDNQYMPNRYGAGTYYGGTATRQDIQSQMNQGTPSNWGGDVGAIISGGSPGIIRAGNTVGDSIDSFFGGIGNAIMKIWNPTNDNFTGPNPPSYYGCFVAGTPVLLADGSEKPIETLQIGERVIGHDGTKQTTTTILARITPLARVVYKLTFSNGSTLTTTNSHPISTLQGWKALSVEQAQAENPGLPVTTLNIGDFVYTVDSVHSLVAIEEKQVAPIFNIAVGEPHTFYANKILVHNKGGAETANLSSQTGGGEFHWPALPEMKWPELPEIKWPSLPEIKWPGLPEIKWPSLPEIKWPSLPEIKWPGLPEIKWPSLPEIKWPSLPEIKWPSLPEIKWPSLPEIKWPSLPEIHWPSFPSFSWPSLPTIQWPSLPTFSWPTLPSFSWPSFPSFPTFTWPSLPSFTWPSLPDFKWPSLPEFKWPSLPEFHWPSFPEFHWPPLPQITISSFGLPGFASGVQNFQPGGASGLALVGESGPELVMLPSGSSVYPMSTGAGVSGGVSSLGGGGGVQTANIVVQLDSQMLVSAMGLSLASDIRLSLGRRSY